MTSPLADPLRRLQAVLDSLGIRNAIIGSLASSAHGIGRSTSGADLLARIVPSLARPLLAALGQDWYGDIDEIEAASRDGRSFSLIYIPTAMKVDIFPARTEFHDNQLTHATEITR